MPLTLAPGISSHTGGAVITPTADTQPPLPPFTRETAVQKV
jgi:hypothetical protein